MEDLSEMVMSMMEALLGLASDPANDFNESEERWVEAFREQAK